MSHTTSQHEQAVQVAGDTRAHTLETFHALGDQLADAMRHAKTAGVGFNTLQRSSGMSTHTVQRILADAQPRDANLDSSAAARVVEQLAAQQAQAREAYVQAIEQLARTLRNAKAAGVPITRLQVLGRVSRPSVYDLLAGKVNPDPARAGRQISDPRAARSEAGAAPIDTGEPRAIAETKR